MRRIPLVLIAALLAVGLVSPRASHAQGDRLCFNVPGISNCIEGRFREYWQQNGGLAVFGYPVTAATPQQTAEGSFLTQYFERNSFELHPEKARPYDVLLGRLGDVRLKQIGRNWAGEAKAAASAPHFFGETGHAIAHEPFWRYWSSHGLEFDGARGTSYVESLALLGLPLTEPKMETNSSGDTVLTQWFERGRFEDHGAKGVLLGLLGNETRQAPGPGPQPSPPPANDPCAGIGAPVDAIIEPNCLRFGETFLVEVGGFDPNQEIGFWITDEFGTTVGTAQTIRVDEEGSLVVEVVTSDYFGFELRPGNYVFVAQDAANQYRPSTAPFRVLP